MDNIEVRVHKEIRQYREKYYGFTARQIVSAIITLLIVVPVYAFVSPVLGDKVAMTIAAVPAVPVVLIGWVTYQGLDFEKIFQFILRNKTELNNPLKYETDMYVKARQYYYSHLPKFFSLRMQFSSKAKRQADAYFENTSSHLMAQIQDGTAPKIIKPKKLSHKEIRQMKARQQEEKTRREMERQEQDTIKERADKRKQSIDASIVTHKNNTEEKMTEKEKQDLLSSLFKEENSGGDEQ